MSEYKCIQFHEFNNLMNSMGFKTFVCSAHEFVYVRQIEARGFKIPLQLMIYSSVHTSTMKTRDCGEDAIRFLVTTNEQTPKVIKKYGRVNRTKGALNRVLNKSRKIFLDLMNQEKCKLCGNIMLERNGKYGNFLGCASYPKCNNTVNL